MATDNTALGRDVVPGAVPAVHVSQLVKRYGVTWWRSTISTST